MTDTRQGDLLAHAGAAFEAWCVAHLDDDIGDMETPQTNPIACYLRTLLPAPSVVWFGPDRYGFRYITNDTNFSDFPDQEIYNVPPWAEKILDRLFAKYRVERALQPYGIRVAFDGRGVLLWGMGIELSTNIQMN